MVEPTKAPKLPKVLLKPHITLACSLAKSKGFTKMTLKVVVLKNKANARHTTTPKKLIKINIALII